MIHIHCARAHRLWAPLVDELKKHDQAGENITLLVPEQYTLQAERDLLADLRLKGFFRLDVLSPSRLSYRVFQTLGADARVRIDERGKAVAVARALKQTAPALQYYAGSVTRTGLIQKMGQLLGTVKGARLNPEQLLEAADRLSPRGLGLKLRDTALTLSAYQELLSDRFADAQDIHRDMLSRLQRGGLLAGHQVFVYGFDVLTESLRDLLRVVATQAADVHVYLVSEKEQAQDGDSFTAVRQSVERLINELKAHGARAERRRGRGGHLCPGGQPARLPQCAGGHL